MKTLVHYVKNDKGQRIGCVVAIGAELVGWSQCNKKDRSGSKRFDKQKALSLAIKRAEKGSSIFQRLSTTGKMLIFRTPNKFMKSAIAKMEDRAKLYFKEDWKE